MRGKTGDVSSFGKAAIPLVTKPGHSRVPFSAKKACQLALTFTMSAIATGLPKKLPFCLPPGRDVQPL